MSRSLKDYAFELPEELIARRPSSPRDGCRLLRLDRMGGGLKEAPFSALPRMLKAGDLLVFNDSEVLRARLFGRKVRSGGRVEILLLQQTGQDLWRALVRGKVRRGSDIDFQWKGIAATVRSRGEEGEVTLLFRPPGAAEELMREKGYAPLPPYLGRKEVAARALRRRDLEWYQTVYASKKGSVAAPTAGLHFTRRLLAALDARGVERTAVTLHVGAGTFRPLRHEEIDSNALQPERVIVSAAAARKVNEARRRGGRVVAVGTTVTRSLESFAAEGGRVAPGRREVDLMILPGYRFQVVDGLVTNFHLPRSSLLLLVSAFAGREPVIEAYREAVRRGFRFYSYGDAMLVL